MLILKRRFAVWQSSYATAAATCCVLLLLSTRASASNDSRDNNYDYYNDDEDSNGSDGNIFTNFLARMDEDVSEMWFTAPYNWSTEYWEVLTGAALVLVLAVLLLCCAPICCCGSSDNSTHKDIAIMTADELKNNDPQKQRAYAELGDIERAKWLREKRRAAAQQKRQEGSSDGLMMVGAPTPVRSNTSKPEKSPEKRTPTAADDANHGSAGALSPPTTPDGRIKRSGSSSSPRRSSTKRKTPRQRTTLWNEVVSVWGEFLQHGFNAPLTEEEKEKRLRRSAARSASLVSIDTNTLSAAGESSHHEYTQMPDDNDEVQGKHPPRMLV